MADVLSNAPKEDAPAPLSVNALVLVTAKPLRSKLPPEATLIAPAEVPNALALPSFNVPALIAVPPVNVLAADTVHVPVPALVSAPVPDIVPA